MDRKRVRARRDRLIRGRAQSGDEINLLSDLGLDIVEHVVGVVAGEHLAAGDRSLGAGGPHLLDVVLVSGVDNRRNVEVGFALPAAEGDLAEHTVLVALALLKSNEVADVGFGESDGGVLLAGDGHGLNLRVALTGSEDDGANFVIESLKGDGAGGNRGDGGGKGEKSLGELHFGCC